MLMDGHALVALTLSDAGASLVSKELARRLEATLDYLEKVSLENEALKAKLSTDVEDFEEEFARDFYAAAQRNRGGTAWHLEKR